MEWDTVIGLEVHAQLKTKSKLFSGASTAYGAKPNSQTCFIDAGLPGVLPVLNQEAIVMAIQLGLALRADINDLSYFERKNYFYPDLPKGYQISQFQKPIISQGSLRIRLKNNQEKIVTIERAHLEEDAGKSLHDKHNYYTGIDLNRAGTALLEIVTSPCLYSAEETISYLKTLHQLVRFLGICDGNMQEGSFRCDVNLSLKPKGSKILGTRTELKNLNSFRYIEKAIAYEQARHQELLENGQTMTQETRLYNPDTNSTQCMRQKENENDYRYFPDPDLLPIQITRYQIAEIKRSLPDLPEQIIEQLKKTPAFNEEDIEFILSSPANWQFYKAVKSLSHASEKLIINWMKGHYMAALNESKQSFESPPLPAKTFAAFLDKIKDNTLSTSKAKTVFLDLWSSKDTLEKLLSQHATTINDSETLDALINTIIQQHPAQVADYKAGKEKLLAFFIGQLMKATKGQGEPAYFSDLLKKKLEQN